MVKRNMSRNVSRIRRFNLLVKGKLINSPKNFTAISQSCIEDNDPHMLTEPNEPKDAGCSYLPSDVELFDPAFTTISTRLGAAAEKKEENHHYFIAYTKELNKLFNESFRGHVEQNSKCTGNLVLEKSSQKLISSSWRLKCEVCNYISSPKNMYN